MDVYEDQITLNTYDMEGNLVDTWAAFAHAPSVGIFTGASLGIIEEKGQMYGDAAPGLSMD